MRQSVSVSVLLAASLLSGCQPTPPPPVCNDAACLVPKLENASRILVRNAALVLTMDPTRGQGPLGTLEEADVLFEGDTLAAVGKGLEPGDATVVDATGKIVMPGFVNVHDHLWQTLIRGCATDQDLYGWLRTCVFPMSGVGLSEEEGHAAVRLGTVDLIGTGVTTVVDDSHAFNTEFARGNLRALDESGLRYVFAHCGGEDRFDEMRSIHAQLATRTPGASFQVCSHPASFMQSSLDQSTALARALGVPLNVHLAENLKDLNDDQMASLRRANAFGGKVLANHVIHVTTEEMDVLARHDVRVAHNPLSNMRLASGIMRLGEMRARGIKVGLGLDGGTNDSADAFANMKAAIGLQRALHKDASVYPTVTDVLWLATMGGAEVLDMQDSIGSLTPGKKADLLIIDPNATNFAPRWDWLSQLVFNGQPSNVEYVFIGGRVRKAGGEVLNVKREQLLESMQAAVARVKAALGY
jgi:5-methylthioadenosine/S-adenosylhomocysteine deaminase